MRRGNQGWVDGGIWFGPKMSTCEVQHTESFLSSIWAYTAACHNEVSTEEN